jgi:hypothetical protein
MTVRLVAVLDVIAPDGTVGRGDLESYREPTTPLPVPITVYTSSMKVSLEKLSVLMKEHSLVIRELEKKYNELAEEPPEISGLNQRLEKLKQFISRRRP